MTIAFRRVTAVPLADFDVTAPDGSIIGVIGENGSGKSRLLRLAAGAEEPESGSVERSGPAKWWGPSDALNLSPAAILLIDQTFARQDALVKERAAIALDRMRRNGATVLLASHDEGLLSKLVDEVWWIRDGRLAGRGDPEEMLGWYRRHIAGLLRAWGEKMTAPIAPRMRRGDGRAELVAIETIGENGQPTMVWRSGELAVVRVRIRFRSAVEDPVAGIMIRSRAGLNVYGTNTELERVKLGPCAANETLTIGFAFRCELCPGSYTITVASHDPDGVWHDWLEDAVAFSVTSDRFTAGVANLRARVTLLDRQ